MVTSTEASIGLQSWFYEITIKTSDQILNPWSHCNNWNCVCVHECTGLCVSVHMYKCVCVCVCVIYYNQSLRFLEVKQPQVKFYCFCCWFSVTQRDNNILSHSSLCLEFFLKKCWGNRVDSFKISLRFSFTNAYLDLTGRGSQFLSGSTVQVCLEQSGDSSTTQLPSGHSPAMPHHKEPRLLDLAFPVCRIQPLLPVPPLFSLSRGLALSPTFCFLHTASPIGHPRRNTRQSSSHQCHFHFPNLTNSSPIQNLTSIHSFPVFSTWNQNQAQPNSCSHRQWNVCRGGRTKDPSAILGQLLEHQQSQEQTRAACFWLVKTVIGWEDASESINTGHFSHCCHLTKATLERKDASSRVQGTGVHHGEVHSGRAWWEAFLSQQTRKQRTGLEMGLC